MTNESETKPSNDKLDIADAVKDAEEAAKHESGYYKGFRMVGQRKAKLLHNIVTLLNLMAKHYGVNPMQVLKHVAGTGSIDVISRKYTTKQLSGVISGIMTFNV